MLAAILRFVALGSLCGAASAAALPLATSLRTDWRGNLTTYAYDDANRLQTRTEPLQKVTTYGYDGLGNVKRETDAENGVTLHDYDGLSRRIKTTDAELGDTFFKYDGNGNKVETTDAEGRIAKHEYDGLDRLHRALADTTGENAVTVYDYDKNGNVIGVTDPNNFKTIHTYDENNRKETTRDPLTFETRFEYDKVGNKKLERNARGYARGWDYDELNRTKLVQDETGQQTAYEYDKVGNRTEERWPNGNIVTHRYDELNRRKSANDRVGLVGEWKYDAQGNLETETSGNGHITTHLYDELNRRYETRAPSAAGMRILAFTHDKLGNVKTERDANGNVTTHDYDKLNRLRRTFDAIGDRYLATYDKVGNKKTETDANGFVDTHTYDGLNRRIKTTDLLAGATSTVMEAAFDKAGNKLSEKDANLRETTYKYDAMNRLETVTRAGVLMVKNEYDPVGNLRFVTDALGNKVGYQYDARSFRFQEDRALGAITRFTPTAMADVAEVLDAEGRKTVNTYDFRRRLETVTNGASELTRYGYDLNGNRTSVQKPKGTNFFQNFEYDAANRLVKVTTPAGASELTYDLHGNLIRRKDALNHSTAYSDFDARNRRRLTTFADTKTEATTYDGVGNVKTLRDSNGATTTYTYDERHRERFKRYSASVDGLTEIETTYDAVGNVKTTKETYGAATRLHQRDYDAFNRLEREVDAWNDEVRHTYDLQGNRKTTTAQGATTLYGYDELNRRKSVTTAAGVTELEYDRTNLPTAVRYPNGVVSTTTYDRAMRVETVKHAKGATTLESVAHTYDFNGNRKTQTRVAGALTENTTYDYDFDDWLTGTTVTKTDGAGTSTQGIVYTLDAVGNRKREDSTATGLDAAAKTYAKVFTVDERDRVRNVATTGAGAGTTAYVYDDNGNLTSKSGSTGSKTYVWNVRDRLVEVRDGATPIARYKYNAEGLRDEVEGERRTTWVNGFAYLDKTPASGLLAKYETHPNGRSPILAVSPAGTEFLHSDALGSSTLSTNNAGTTNAATTYDEWGNSITTGATINKFGYTGHETDHNTGLVYFKARHYDPELGKFISADPFEGTPNYPVTWNGYLYANGNPLVWIDRDGYESIPGMDSKLDGPSSSPMVTPPVAVPCGPTLCVVPPVVVPGVQSAGRQVLNALKTLDNALRISPVNILGELALEKMRSLLPTFGDKKEVMVGESPKIGVTPGPTLLPHPAAPQLPPLPPSTRPDENPGNQVLITPNDSEKFGAYDRPSPGELPTFDNPPLTTPAEGPKIPHLILNEGDETASGQQSQGGIEIPLARPPGVTDEQWKRKLDALNQGAAEGRAKVVHKPERTGEAQRQARKEGKISPGDDADHGLDLQFGGRDVPEEIISTNKRVNRSVGGQGKGRLQYPDGTPIKCFTEKCP